MKDPCETCKQPLDSVHCKECKYNEDNWNMRTPGKGEAAQKHPLHIPPRAGTRDEGFVVQRE